MCKFGAIIFISWRYRVHEIDWLQHHSKVLGWWPLEDLLFVSALNSEVQSLDSVPTTDYVT